MTEINYWNLHSIIFCWGNSAQKTKGKSKYLWGRSQITRPVMGGGGEGLKIIMIIK